jgi:hypothetical protein
MSVFDRAGSFFVELGSRLLGGGMMSAAEKARYNKLDKLGNYYTGNQDKQLKVKSGKEDDNVILNLLRKVVDKSAQMLVGGGIEFDFGEEDESKEIKTYIDSVYDKNRREIMLLNAAKTAGTYKTGYIKILPDYYDEDLPRLERLHPIQMKIIPEPEDIETVAKYIQAYTFARNGEEVSKEIHTEKVYKDVIVDGEDREELKGWVVIYYEASKATNGKMVEVERTEWNYMFPPIIHWQNLPTDENVYGESDIEDVLELQDKVNYNASKIGRIIRYHAHPKLWAKGFSNKEMKSWGEDEVIAFKGDGMMSSIEMSSDLQSSMNYLSVLMQSVYDITSTTNIATIKDKLGQITNFGLRVLYQDALEKLSAKRLTFGEMLIELNRRLLVLQNEKYDGDGGVVVWPTEVIPQSQAEEAELLASDVENGFVSKQTARGLRGYDHEQELERIEEEAPDDIGVTILNALERGV